MRALVPLLFALTAFAQESPVFQSAVSLVHVDVEVTDATGRVVDTLSRKDFRVFDKREEQAIRHFSKGDEPLDLILLFDISGSMRPKVAEVAAAARQGIYELRPGDRAAAM